MQVSCPTCHFIRPSGRRCGSPSLRGEQFCYYHHPTHRPPTRTATPAPFHLPPITDHEELQIAFSEIIRRIADNTLEPRRAGLLLYSLQMAKANLPALLSGASYCSEPASPDSPNSRKVPDFPDLAQLLAGLTHQPNAADSGH